MPDRRRRRSCALAFVAAALAAAAISQGASPAANVTWTGRWRLDPNGSPGFYKSWVFTLKQEGARVTGAFPWPFSAEHGFGSPPCFTGSGGTISGTAKGRTLRARLVYPQRGGHPRATASLRATLSPNGRAITGRGEMLSGECGRGVYYAIRAVRVSAKR